MSSDSKQPRPLTCSMFGGASGEACNALYSALGLVGNWMDDETDYSHYTALEQCAEAELMKYLAEHPRGSLVCHLVDALGRFGYEVRKKEGP